MKANGIARLGLGCALALSINTIHATTLGDLWISEVMPDPAAISDAAGEWFELYNPAATPFNLNGTTLGDDGSDLHRIETDLLILPGEYLTLARSAAPGFAPDYVYSSFTLGNSGDEIVLRDPLGDVLRLDYGASFEAPGRSRELLTLPLLAANYGLTPPELVYASGDIGTPGFAGSADLSPVPLPAGAWLFITGVAALFMSSRGLTAGSRGESRHPKYRLQSWMHKSNLSSLVGTRSENTATLSIERGGGVST